MLGDKRYCYPLTVTDHASRYLLLCEAMESNAEKPALRHLSVFSKNVVCRGRSARTMAFRSLPPTDLFNLSKLSVWWLRLGISIERIKPGHPQQNGRHERMHLTLKKEATGPPAPTSFSSKPSSTTSLRNSTTNARMKLWR